MNNQAKLDANVRLCRAVQQHPCLYDRSNSNDLQREAYDHAWSEIAKKCEDSVSSCKLRWRNIRRSFIRSVAGTPKKRKISRTQKYYLHDVLEFFLPHINSGPEAGQLRESDDETESVKARRWISDNKTKTDGEIQNEERVEVGESERKGAVNVLPEQETNCEVKGNIDNGAAEEIAGEKNDGIKTEEKMKDHTKSTKRSTSARRKVLEKDSEDMKVGGDKIDELRPNRRSQSSRNKVVEKIDTADETEQKVADAKSNKKAQTPNNITGTFYISPKNSDKGTFFIRKNNGNGESENAPKDEGAATCNDDANVDSVVEFNNDSKEDNPAEVTEEADETEDSFTTQQDERRSRFKRACKRGLDKTMMNQLRLRQKEPEVKRIRHSAERLKSLAKATLELAESIGTPKKEPKAMQVQTKTTPNLQNEGAEMEVQPPTTSAASSTTQILTDKAAPKLSVKLSDTKLVRAITVESQKAETSTTHVHQGVQCSLDPASTDDTFLSTLKPYLNNMNVRQKLHFKKKIFESLMEVFDSAVDFPGSDKAKLAATSPPAIIPTQLKTVSNEEVRLVRELVAIVQAAKQMPELNLNASGGIESVNEVVGEKRPMVSPSATVSVAAIVPPPPLTLRAVPTINTSLQSSTATGIKLPAAVQISKSVISPNITPSASTSTPVFATSTPLASSGTTTPPFVQRRVIRKLVKVNDLGQGTYSIAAPSPVNATSTPPTNSDALRRRILRIFPKTSLSNTNLENTVTSSGVGTFIVPRSTADGTASVGAPRIKVVTTAATSSTASAPSTTQYWRQFVTPVSTNGWTTTTISNPQNTPAITIRNVGESGGARPVRRYSVCGALPNVAPERQTKFLTTTANTNSVTSAPKITIGARGSPASFITKDFFKLPTPLRSTATAAGTNTTASRTMPALSVTVSERNSSARTVPLTTGFNRFLRNEAPSSSNFHTPSPPCSISVNSGGGVKRSLGLSSISAEKRICPEAERSQNDEAGGEDMAGIIASDDFAVLNIKSEPIDDDF